MVVDMQSEGYSLHVSEDEASVLIEALSALKSVDKDLLKRDVPDKYDRPQLEEELVQVVCMCDLLTAATELMHEVDGIDGLGILYP